MRFQIPDERQCIRTVVVGCSVQSTVERTENSQIVRLIPFCWSTAMYQPQQNAACLPNHRGQHSAKPGDHVANELAIRKAPYEIEYTPGNALWRSALAQDPADVRLRHLAMNPVEQTDNGTVGGTGKDDNS